MAVEDAGSPGMEINPEGLQEILRLFSGRRQGTRVDREHPVECQGPHGSYEGRTINLSRLGALLTIEDASFPSPKGPGALLAVAREVWQQFPRGLSIRFQEARVRIDANVVRVVPHPAADGVVLGCGFVRPLTTRQCRALDVPSEDRGDATP